MPGNRGRDDFERARRDQPLRDAAHPVGLEVVDERGVGREEAGPDPRVEVDLVVATAPGAPNIVGSPDLPSTSTMSTLDPARAAVTASAAVTVVFPTPPLPATMTTWEAEQNRATSIPACYERPMRSPRTPSPRHCRGGIGARGVGVVGRRGRRSATRADSGSGNRGIVIVQVNGLLDPPNAALDHEVDA